MAVLKSEEKDCPSSLEIQAGDKQNPQRTANESWQNVKITLRSNDQVFSTAANENCSLCRKPSDEIEKLIQALKSILEGKSKETSWEPNEPSFELNFSQSHHQGIKVEAWIDNGNSRSGFYTWDAAGIRFFTTAALLSTFISQLEAEFLD